MVGMAGSFWKKVLSDQASKIFTNFEKLKMRSHSDDDHTLKEPSHKTQERTELDPQIHQMLA